MSKQRWAVTGVVVVAVVALACAWAWSDVTPLYPHVASGAVQPMASHPAVEMRSEVVKVELRPYLAKVDCTFVFVNTGPGVRVTMGFPEVVASQQEGEGEDEGEAARPDAQETQFLLFRAYVDGQPVAAKRHPAAADDESADFAFAGTGVRWWWVLDEVPFAEGQERVVRMTYEVELRWLESLNESGYRHFVYPMQTGGAWKGAIGTAEITLDLQEFEEGGWEVDLKPAGYKRLSPSTVSWQWASFEPTGEHDIWVSFGPSLREIWVDGVPFEERQANRRDLGPPWPRLVGNELLASASSVADWFGLEEGGGQTYTLRGRGREMVVTAGNRFAQVGGQRVDLGVDPIWTGEGLSLPVGPVAKVFGGRLRVWDGRAFVHSPSAMAEGRKADFVTRELTPDEVVELTEFRGERLRREIYARHGRVFQDASSIDWQTYFLRQAWYEPNRGYRDALLTPAARANLALIEKVEACAGNWLLATDYRQQAEYAQAIAEYDKVLAGLPNFAMGFYHRGLAYHRMGDYDRAIADYDHAISLNPESAEPYYNKALACEAHGRLAEAVAAYRKFVALPRPKPGEMDCWFREEWTEGPTDSVTVIVTHHQLPTTYRITIPSIPGYEGIPSVEDEREGVLALAHSEMVKHARQRIQQLGGKTRVKTAAWIVSLMALGMGGFTLVLMRLARGSGMRASRRVVASQIALAALACVAGVLIVAAVSERPAGAQGGPGASQERTGPSASSAQGAGKRITKRCVIRWQAWDPFATGKVVVSGGWGEGPGEFGQDRNGLYWGPEDFCVSSEGDIYVYDTQNKRIQRFSSEGRYLSQTSAKWSDPVTRAVAGTEAEPSWPEAWEKIRRRCAQHEGESHYDLRKDGDHVAVVERKNARGEGQLVLRLLTTARWGSLEEVQHDAAGNMYVLAALVVDIPGDEYTSDIDLVVVKFTPSGDHVGELVVPFVALVDQQRDVSVSASGDIYQCQTTEEGLKIVRYPAPKA